MPLNREEIAKLFFEAMKKRSIELGETAEEDELAWDDKGPEAAIGREVFLAGADAIIASGLAH